MKKHNTPKKDVRSKGLVRSLHSLIRKILKANDEEILRDTIEDILAADTKLSSIEMDEWQMLSSVLKLRQKTVAEAMVPRVDIIAVDLNTPLNEVARLMARGRHSRFPVYKGNLDNVVGVVHVRDLLNCLLQNDREKYSLIKITRELPIVTPGMKILNLIKQMREDRTYIALVVDEFGGIDGLVTMEDLVEEIIGDLEDEYDVNTPNEIIQNPDGSFTVDARMLIEDLTEKTGFEFKENISGAINSVGGLVFSLAGHVPQKGEKLLYATNIEFEVLEADPNRVRTIKISKKS